MFQDSGSASTVALVAAASEAPAAAAADRRGAKSIRESVREHDRFQFEVDLDYGVVPGMRTRYNVVTYLFIPYTLGISESTFSKDDFYQRIQNYIRLSPAHYSLQDLATGEDSPFVSLERELGELKEGDVRAESQIVTKLKVLATTFKESLAADFPNMSRSNAIGAIELYEERLLAVLRRFRALDRSINQESLGSGVAEAFRLIDERMSLVAERALLRIHLRCKRLASPAARTACEQRVRAIIAAESTRRATRNPALTLHPASDNEPFIQRSSFLKKYSSSVLYLATSRAREGVLLEHLLFSFAAGVAMAVATVMAFYSERQFGAVTVPLMTALVVGYMFKDRIKEIARARFSRFLRGRISDHRTTIRTPDGEVQIGHMLERVRFVPRGEVPAHILELRGTDAPYAKAGLGPRESVLRYEKRVTLRPEAFSAICGAAPGVTGIRDILRFDVRPFLRKMGNPIERRPILEGNTIRLLRCRKTYALDIISHCNAPMNGDGAHVAHSRLVLDRKGIRRVERGVAASK